MKKSALIMSLVFLPHSVYAITTTIPAGTVQTGGDVNTVVTQNVYGEADNFTVSGNQQIMSGGISKNSNIYPYGQQNVYKGGTSYNTNIQYSAMQNIQGNSYTSNVESQGTMNVNSGGNAFDTTVNGGTMSVLKGGTSQGTVLSSGTVNVYGTDNGTTINGGLYEIKYRGISNNAILTNGTQKIDSGGKAKYTTINGGTQEVYGDSLNSTLNTGGVMNVYSSGYVENSTINGGTLTLKSEAFAQNNTMLSGNENVYGQDIGSTIKGGVQKIYQDGVADEVTITENGKQEILQGAYAYNNNVSNGGIQQIDEGGYAYRSNVESGGTMNVSGGSYESNIAQGGIINVLAGGNAEDTTVNGGSLLINANAAAQGTNLSSGTETIYGTDKNSSISGGEQIVESGGIISGNSVSGQGKITVNAGGNAENTNVKGGGLYIKSGAISNNSIISAGTEYVEGISNNATIKNTGSQNILSGGQASGSKISNFGTQNIYEGGLASNSTINIYGRQNIYEGGVSDKAQINFWGTQKVYNGGKVTNSNVNTGGTLTIFSGGIAENTKVTGGVLQLKSGGMLMGQTTANNSIINVSGNNTIPQLDLNKSLVNVVYTPNYTTLNINQLNGNGVFSLRSDLSQNKADILNVRGGDGNFGLIVNDYSLATAPKKYKIIDESSSAHDNFYLIGGGVDVGAYVYDLKKENNAWYLERTDILSNSSYIAKNTYSSLSSLFYTHINPVYNHLRIGHKNKQEKGGLWVDSIGRRVKLHYKDKTKSQIDVYGGSLGADYQIWQNDNYTARLGIYGGYTDSKQTYDRMGRGDGDTKSLGLYGTLANENNWFVDFVGTYFWHEQEIKSYTPAQDVVRGKYDTNSWQMATYLGKRIELENNWFLEPTAGLSYMHVEGLEYRTNYNTYVKASGAGFLSGSVGLYGGKEISFNNGMILNAYGRTNLIYDWDGKSKVQVSDYVFEEDIASLRYEFGAGVNAKFDEQSSAYFEATTQLGDQVDIPWEFNVGYRYAF